ncbi:hypothetical protein, partial [Streptomyces sp. NPDC006333]|uniref:hypothetical protein n=1 Tax=Streptomyces sp. NPDC006333 TaxID=3156753 RepID=UPI0033BB61E8
SGPNRADITRRIIAAEAGGDYARLKTGTLTPPPSVRTQQPPPEAARTCNPRRTSLPVTLAGRPATHSVVGSFAFHAPELE